MNTPSFSMVAALAFGLLVPFVARAQDEPKPTGDPVAATVNGDKVYRSEVLRTFFTTLKGRHQALDAADRNKMLASILDEVIDQRLVYQFLKQSGKTVDKQTTAAEIRSIGEGLKKQRTTWKEYLKGNGYTQTTFERQIAWRLSWQAYLAATITDKLLEEYFTSHLAEYDGSEVRASHILLRIDDQSSGEEVQQLVSRAQDIRKQITADQLTFADAAKKYSSGPSRLRGGDIGFFPRHGVQGEAFSSAAFGLKEKEVSDPVVTKFGVHLIQATDIRSGPRTWTDVRAQLRRDITRELFEKIAQKQRATAALEFTKAVPHFGN